MFGIINKEPEIDADNTTCRKLDNIQGDIEFKNVYFSYPARPKEQIFRGFCSLPIHAACQFKD